MRFQKPPPLQILLRQALKVTGDANTLTGSGFLGRFPQQRGVSIGKPSRKRMA